MADEWKIQRDREGCPKPGCALPSNSTYYAVLEWGQSTPASLLARHDARLGWRILLQHVSRHCSWIAFRRSSRLSVRPPCAPQSFATPGTSS